jgi:hypothetical protein
MRYIKHQAWDKFLGTAWVLYDSDEGKQGLALFVDAQHFKWPV